LVLLPPLHSSKKARRCILTFFQMYARLFSIVCVGTRRSRLRVLWQFDSPLTHSTASAHGRSAAFGGFTMVASAFPRVRSVTSTKVGGKSYCACPTLPRNSLEKAPHFLDGRLQNVVLCFTVFFLVVNLVSNKCMDANLVLIAFPRRIFWLAFGGNEKIVIE